MRSSDHDVFLEFDLLVVMSCDALSSRRWSQSTVLELSRKLLIIILEKIQILSTYGHSQLKTGHPVRSAIHKQLNGRLVLRWVTTWESLLLYVLHFFLPVLILPYHIPCDNDIFLLAC